MARLKGISPNVNAFLDTLAYAEGTSTSPVTLDDGYDVVVTGVDGRHERFTDYSKHPFTNRPPKVINKSGLESTAAGRYQALLRWWTAYARMLALKDFSPESQDKDAIQRMKEGGALRLIENGNFDGAVNAVRNIWASLPGANYEGQPMRKMDDLRKYYLKKGGSLWVSPPSLSPPPQPSPPSSPPGSVESTLPNQNSSPKTLMQMLKDLFSRIKPPAPPK